MAYKNERRKMNNGKSNQKRPSEWKKYLDRDISSNAASIVFLRHGTYSNDQLTRKGRDEVKQSAEKLAQDLKNVGINTVEILYSPTERTRETAEIAKDVFDKEGFLVSMKEEHNLRPDASPMEVDELKRIENGKCRLLITHSTVISQITSKEVGYGGYFKFTKNGEDKQVSTFNPKVDVVDEEITKEDIDEYSGTKSFLGDISEELEMLAISTPILGIGALGIYAGFVYSKMGLAFIGLGFAGWGAIGFISGLAGLIGKMLGED